MGRFAGKVALVTGGGTGIGKAIAAALAQEGAKVVIGGRREKPLADAAKELGVLAVRGDVAVAADRKRLIAETVRALGGLDILVNNAGVGILKPLAETSDDELATLFATNVIGLAALTREALPELTRRKGNVINVSSVVGSAVLGGATAYSATKAAVDHFTRALAAEAGPLGVRVNAVAPGLTETDMAAPMTSDPATVAAMTAQTPLRRLGRPADIAETVMFLASEAAGWVTGQVVHASGGLML